MPATSRLFNCAGCNTEFRASSLTTVGNERFCQNCYSRLFINCSGCGEIISRDTAARYSVRFYCEDCYSELFTTCHSCRAELEIQHAHVYVPINVENMDEDTENTESRTELFCNRCYERDFRRCTNCGDRHPRATMRENPYGDDYCTTCWESNCTYCGECGNMMWQGDARWHGDEPRCNSCAAQTDEWDQQEFKCPDPTFDRVGTKLKFGVEIETAQCDSHWELCGETIWGCEYDCSVSGKEFISPPMFGDQGLDSITEFCQKARDRDWRVDDRCGLHLHFDMGAMESGQLFSLAYGYRLSWALWKRFVSTRRGNYDMCGSPRYTLDDIRKAKCWEYFVGARDRFEYVNWRSYFKHGTFEIRLGEPTFDGNEIVNWVITHGLFIERIKNLSFKEIDAAFGDGSSSTRAFSFCANFVWNERPELIEYLRQLSRRYHDRGIQIRGRRHYPAHAIFRDA